KASGITIQDSDGTTPGPVQSSEIVVNNITNPGATTSVLFNVPTLPSISLPEGVSIANATGTITGNLGTLIYDRAFDAIIIHNESAKSVRLLGVTPFSPPFQDVTIFAGSSS